MMFLDEKDFKQVIANTPLVSIDLIIMNTNNEILLGKRVNRPAKGYWFVPGGRILKNESIYNAFQRLMLEEVGISLTLDKAVFHGVFDHFYDDSIFGESISTHYVAIAYKIVLEATPDQLPYSQHNNYCWVKVDALLQNNDVQKHTKAYFTDLSL